MAERVNTSTQIRTMYSDGMSFMTIKFYNTSLSFQFNAFVGKDQNGRSTYDMQKSLVTTVGYDGAFALYVVAKDIITGKSTSSSSISIPCASDATLTLERRMNNTGQLETIFSISKNGMVIPFKFKTHQINITENGVTTTKTIESALGAFEKTIDGYLTGINSDRHLDKLTEDYAKAQQGAQGNNPGQFQTGAGNNGGYKKPWQQNGGGYRKPWQNNNFQNKQPWNGNQPQQQQQPNQQNMSTFEVPN